MSENSNIFDCIEDTCLCVLNEERSEILYQNHRCPYGEINQLLQQMEGDTQLRKVGEVSLHLKISEIKWNQQKTWLLQICNAETMMFRETSARRLHDIEQIQNERLNRMVQISYDMKESVKNLCRKANELQQMIDSQTNALACLNEISATSTQLLDKINEV